jgi:hypothetical protein
MDITQIFKTLITALLVITFVMLVVSAYQQYRSSSEMALLSDSTSSITTHLALDELAYVDAAGTSHPYVVDSAKLPSLETKYTVGGENFEFQISVLYMQENERVLGPYGPALPEEKMNCTLIFAATLFENGRYLPAKIKVMAWRA